MNFKSSSYRHTTSIENDQSKNQQAEKLFILFECNPFVTVKGILFYLHTFIENQLSHFAAITQRQEELNNNRSVTLSPFWLLIFYLNSERKMLLRLAVDAFSVNIISTRAYWRWQYAMYLIFCGGCYLTFVILQPRTHWMHNVQYIYE